MSETMRIALIAEGPTDRIVIEAALNSILSDRSYVLNQIQPETCQSFENELTFGATGSGWGGVYAWCHQAVTRSVNIEEDPLFFGHDILIIHLDTDVAGQTYEMANIREKIKDLPCEMFCPPPNATTDQLRKVMLRWIGAIRLPKRVVFCTPSKSMEAWVVKSLFPSDKEAGKQEWECYPTPEKRLAQQPVKKRIQKSVRDYENNKRELQSRWSSIVQELTEARRFQDEFLQEVQ